MKLEHQHDNPMEQFLFINYLFVHYRAQNLTTTKSLKCCVLVPVFKYLLLDALEPAKVLMGLFSVLRAEREIIFKRNESIIRILVIFC